jgi:aminoglycoside 3-N-acetyltransferase I
MTISTRRLRAGDEQEARQMAAVMAAVFEEDFEPLSDEYARGILETAAFWAVAAFDGERVVGGITAHTIPMTRTPSAELFVYDLAVHEDMRRQGVAAQLLATLRAEAAQAGITEVFVPVDADEEHALAFYRSQGGAASAVTFFSWDA